MAITHQGAGTWDMGQVGGGGPFTHTLPAPAGTNRATDAGVASLYYFVDAGLTTVSLSAGWVEIASHDFAAPYNLSHHLFAYLGGGAGAIPDCLVTLGADRWSYGVMETFRGVAGGSWQATGPGVAFDSQTAATPGVTPPVLTFGSLDWTGQDHDAVTTAFCSGYEVPATGIEQLLTGGAFSLITSGGGFNRVGLVSSGTWKDPVADSGYLIRAAGDALVQALGTQTYVYQATQTMDQRVAGLAFGGIVNLPPIPPAEGFGFGSPGFAQSR